MAETNRRVLIASSHPLFAQGLTKLLQKRQDENVNVLGVVSTFEEAISAINELNPDLVIVDYDDESVNREDFLAHFMGSSGKLRVVLLSLKEGGDQAVVYDRRNMAASQIDDWLSEWTQTPNEDSLLSTKGKVPAPRRNFIKHWIGVILLILILMALGIFGLQNNWLLTIPASLQAIPIDQAFNILWKVIAFLFALIVGFILYSVIFFRRKKGDETDGPHVEGNNALEITWTILPLLTVIGFAIYGTINLGEVMSPDPEALEVKVIGQQWAWRFEYPELGITTNELVLPVDKQVLLRMSSVDVVHSFWVPEFRVKQDLLPERETQLRITPNKTGSYKVACAEICGQLHYDMLADVMVVDQSEYEQWVFAQTDIPEDPVARGALWSERYGCVACHSQDGTPGAGPSWLGLFGSEVVFTDGSSTTANEDYIIESIVNPNSRIVEGFTPDVMPQNFSEQLSETQINDLVEFIKTIK